MIGRLIRFFLDNKGGKANGKSKVANQSYIVIRLQGQWF